MGTRAQVLEITDFSKGRNSFDPEFLVSTNQSIDCQNINLLTRGFEKRRGNVAFNATEMVDATTAIVGMGYIKFVSGTEFLNAVAGTKFFTSSSLSGTMVDATGAITITASQDNYWTPVTYNDLQIWFGGAPDAPFKYSGSGNATALGGTPPSARTAFVAANRVFAISTAAAPSIIQWPVLSNPEDWTGTGSGSSLVNKNDGEELLFGVPIGADAAILFKNSSTHLMPLTKSPFPVYTLQTKYGAAGRNAWVNVNGTIYFVTPSKRMKSTRDGVNFTDYPTDVDDLWDDINSSRISNISGIYYPALQQIHWFVSTGSNTKNNVSIIWDTKNECWLYNPTGFKANTSCLVQNRRLFTGHYVGKLFEQDKSATFTDASEASPNAIDAYWQTPWMKLSALTGIIYPYFIDVACLSETSSNLTITYGFDFATDQKSRSVSLVSSSAQWDVSLWDVALWGGQSSIKRRISTSGKGYVFSMKFRNNSASQRFTFQAVSVPLGSDKSGKILKGAGV